MIHHSSYCNYKSNHKWVVTRHVNNMHKNEGRAPTTSTLQPQVGYYTAKEMNNQHETNNQVPHIQHSSEANTIQYDPQIQYNAVNRYEVGPPTSKQYTVTHNPQTNYGADMDTNDESETDDESEVDDETDNESETDEVDIYEILSDISLTFDRLKELKEQYLKALPQIRELEGDKMNNFSIKYAELKVDVIDENDGLENVKIQFGKGVDDESEDGEEFAEEDEVEIEEEDDSEGDTDEEAVDEDNDEDVDTNEDNEDVNEDDNEKVKKATECKGCRKEGFFDFIFDAEKFMDSDFKKKVLEWEKVFRKDITDAIDKDEFNNPEDKDEIIEDVQHLCNEFDENGSSCFKYCSKRKINSISTIADILLTKEVGRNLRQSNPTKYRYIKEMLKPYAKYIRELPNTKVSIHKKRKTLQNPNIGEEILKAAESVVLPLLKKRKCDKCEQ